MPQPSKASKRRVMSRFEAHGLQSVGLGRQTETLLNRGTPCSIIPVLSAAWRLLGKQARTPVFSEEAMTSTKDPLVVAVDGLKDALADIGTPGGTVTLDRPLAELE